MKSDERHPHQRTVNRAPINSVSLQPVGSIGLTDVDILSKSYGRDFLPYPFMSTQPSRFASRDEYVEYAISVPDRFNYGDLQVFRRWAASYAYADIRVECHVQYIPSSRPSVRIVANRVGEIGYLARQRPEDDAIDVYEVSPYDLGAAVAQCAELTRPGRHHTVVIPEYGLPAEELPDDEPFTIQHMVEVTTAEAICRAQVTTFGTVQSHWRPTRRWGFDRGKAAAVWVGIKDDGDYLYPEDSHQAQPMTRRHLADRIDELIAADVSVLREFRNR
ncbi:hypothetical protein [Mycolicibacterium sp. XJ870]